MLCFCRISCQTLQPIKDCYYCSWGNALFYIDGEQVWTRDQRQTASLSHSRPRPLSCLDQASPLMLKRCVNRKKAIFKEIGEEYLLILKFRSFVIPESMIRCALMLTWMVFWWRSFVCCRLYLLLGAWKMVQNTQRRYFLYYGIIHVFLCLGSSTEALMRNYNEIT